MCVVRVIVTLLRAFLLPRAALVAENLALRQQIIVLQRPVKRPHLRQRDRVFWVWLSRIWSDWGYRWIIGELRKLRLRVGRSSVRRILKEAGFTPSLRPGSAR